MALDITAEFAIAKEKSGYDVVFLVELPGLGKFYATQEPGFSGLWLADYGLIADSGILADADLPEYATELHQLRNNGIGQITYQLDPSGFARTGSTNVSLLNQGYVSHTLQELVLNNATARIRFGFRGQLLTDYVSLFLGVVDNHSASFDSFDIDMVDDTTRQFTPLPPQIGSDFLPRSFDQGKAIPIILGAVEDVPLIQLIGAVEDILAFEATVASTYILTNNANATFPPSGEITVTSLVGASTVAYSAVSQFIVSNRVYTRLDLAASLSFTHPSGSPVVLANFDYRYVLGFAGQNVKHIRKNDGTHPTDSPEVKNVALEPGGADHRRLTVIDFDTDQPSMVASIASEARGLNLFPNGLQAHNATDDLSAEGWTTVNGSFDRVLPASTFDYVLRGETLVDQAIPSEAYIDIPVTVGNRYRLTFTVKNVSANFIEVGLGTPSVSTQYYIFSELTSTAEQLCDLSFVAVDSTLRVRLQIENFAPPHAVTVCYFDQFDLYDLATENPAVQLGHLIQTHMGSVQLHSASFEESRDIWGQSGDRLAGVIQQTEEDQALLGRIAAQFRAKTFLNDAGQQKIIAFDQSRIPAYQFGMQHVLKGSMKVSRSPLTEIYTHYYVYYGRVPQDRSTNATDLGGRDAFSGVVYCTPFETNHSTESGLYILCEQAKQNYKLERTLEIFADLIPDSLTAENTLSYIVRRGTHQRYLCEFTSFINVVDIEVADFVTINHLLLPVDHRGNRFEVTSKAIIPNGCFTAWVCEEINPFLFGGYSEHFEPPTRLVTDFIKYDGFELPPPPSLLSRFGTAFACNPFVEHWAYYLYLHGYSFVQDNIIANVAGPHSSLSYDGQLYTGTPEGYYSAEMIVEFNFDNVPGTATAYGFPNPNLVDLRSFCTYNDVQALGTNIRGYYQLRAKCTADGEVTLALQSRPEDRGYFAPPIDLSATVVAATGLIVGDPVKVRFRWECSEDPATNPQPHVLLIGDIWDGSQWVAQVDACYDFATPVGEGVFVPEGALPAAERLARAFEWDISLLPRDSENRPSLKVPVREVFLAGKVSITAASLHVLTATSSVTLIDTEQWETATLSPVLANTHFEGWPQLAELTEGWEFTPVANPEYRTETSIITW